MADKKEFHYCTMWLYKEANSSYVETFNHGSFKNMMSDLHQEEWGGHWMNYSGNIIGSKCLLQGLKIHAKKGYIEKLYTDSILLEYLEEYQKCL